MQTELNLLAHEPAIRLGAFMCVFMLMAICEVVVPRRMLSVPKVRRWVGNLGLATLNSIVLRLLFPFAAVGVAAFAESNGWGLLNYFEVKFWLAAPIAIVALDCTVWLQHVMFHAVPALWRLHRVHHADLDYDMTTGLRFHPVEMVLSMLVKFAAIVVLGAPVVAVLIFEVLLNATSMFNHGNILIPARLDRILRWFVVTPDMHRVHHSVEDDETNSNFGFNLSCWDRLLGTYRDQPRAGHEAMPIGILGHRDVREVETLSGMLALPFRGVVDHYSINRRSSHD